MPTAAARLPQISDACEPPQVLGAARLCTAMMRGATPAQLGRLIAMHDTAVAAQLYDTAIALQLERRRSEAMELQQIALATSPLFRVRQPAARRAAIRVLAIMAAGDLMANTPLDFITEACDVQLDMLVLTPDQTLPDVVPEHDVLFFAAGEPDARMAALYGLWPRPVLNDPELLHGLVRDRLPGLLAGVPELLSPPCVTASHGELANLAAGHCTLADVLPHAAFPILVRPHGSHAGGGLARIATTGELACYLQGATTGRFHVTQFVDYSGRDGMFRKYRVAMIDGQAHLCHMAVSQDWMVHYLNAGMYEHATRRAEEAEAMATFETGFGARHGAALAALQARCGFDYFSIDCAELADGRLLVFEVDTAALVHVMEAPDVFAYKHAHMRLVYDAFEAMLRRRLAGTA
jgi:hypothetical protein